jgi:hypothetical protein
MSTLIALAVAVLAASAAACTTHHRLAPDAPLPPDSRDHLKGALQGAGAGLLTGAAVAAIVGYSAGDDVPCEEREDPIFCLSFTAKEKAGIGAVYAALPSAALGLVIGGVIGSRDVYEHEEVPRVTASVGGGQVTAGASWSF